jgi:hypothetical protein
VRGFVEVARLAVPEFHCHAPVVFASAPVLHLQVQPWSFSGPPGPCPWAWRPCWPRRTWVG